MEEATFLGFHETLPAELHGCCPMASHDYTAADESHVLWDVMALLLVNLDNLSRVSFLVHADPARLADEAKELGALHGWKALSVSRTLALAPKGQATLRQVLEKSIAQIDSEVVILSDVALLFDPALGLDPLGLFRQLASEAKLLIAWTGSYRDGILTYAVPGHAHYRTWSAPDLTVFCL